MLFSKLGRDIAAPANVNGTPRQISPTELGTWMSEAERYIQAIISAGGRVYASRAALYADLTPARTRWLGDRRFDAGL